MFLWLKFTTITPSFYFKNRLFIERGFRVNNMYTFMGSTQKSFTWLPTSSSNLSLYWFRRRGAKWLFFLFFVLLVVFFFFDFSHFTPFGNTQVIRALYYILWRAVDCVFFFTVHFFIFFFATLTWCFRYLTNFASTQYWTSAVHTKDTTPGTLTSHSRLNSLRAVNQVNYSHNSVTSSLTSSDGIFTNTSTVELVGNLYRLLLVTVPTLGLPNPPKTTPLPSLLSNTRFVFALSPTTTHSYFYLQRILPYSVSLNENSVCFRNPNSLTGFFSGFLSPNSINFRYAIQATDVRTMRWMFRNVSSVAKDTSYVRNLLSCSSNRQALAPFLGSEAISGSANVPLALEWFGFRSTYLIRPFLVESLVTNAQVRPRNVSANLPSICRIKSLIGSQRRLFLWSYWSDLFTGQDYLVLNFKSNVGLKTTDPRYRTIRRWF